MFISSYDLQMVSAEDRIAITSKADEMDHRHNEQSENNCSGVYPVLSMLGITIALSFEASGEKTSLRARDSI